MQVDAEKKMNAGRQSQNRAGMKRNTILQRLFRVPYMVLLGALCLGIGYPLQAAAASKPVKNQTEVRAEGPQATSSTMSITLTEAFQIALVNNEMAKESVERIAASRGDAMAALSPYDATVFSSWKKSGFDSLEKKNFPYAVNAARMYETTDIGVRQHIPTGANLSVTYSYLGTDNLGLAGGMAHQSKNYVTFELSQSLLRGIGDKEQRGQIEKAALAVQDSVEARKIVLSQLMTDVAQTYWVLYLYQRNLETARDVWRMAQTLYERERQRHANGISQGVDVDRALTAAKQRELTVRQLERDVAVVQERLAYLLNRPGARFIIASQPYVNPKPVPSRQESVDVALTKRFELLQLKNMLAQVQIDYDVSQNKLLPYLDLNGGYRTSNAVDHLRSADEFRDTNDEGSWYVGVSFAYPLQNREARGNLEKNTRLMNVAKHRIAYMRQSIEMEVVNAIEALQLAKDGIPIASEAYEFSRRTMDGEATRFELLQANNRDFLASQDALARDRMNYDKAIADYNISLINYYYAHGTLLDQYKVVVSEDAVTFKIQ